MRLELAAAFLVASLAFSAPAAPAQQSPFSAAITVNERAITYYEIEQRARLLSAMNRLGDLEEQARDDLIDERLQQIAADRVGLVPQEGVIEEAMANFTEQMGMSDAQLNEVLAANGVERETYRDFVANRTLWRGLIRSLFLADARVSEAEVDRAMALARGNSGASIRLSEIILPLSPELEESNRELAAQLSTSLQQGGSFPDAAQTFSVSPSADRGGSMGWLPLGRLPPQITSMVMSMDPGQVTEPMQLQNALAIFKFHGIREEEFTRPRTASAEYLRIFFPAGSGLAAARELDRTLDTCDDFYGHDDSTPDENVTREVLPTEQIPQEIALEIARLDPGEVSISERRDGVVQFLMLCGRTAELSGDTDREQVRAGLFAQRLQSYADSFLEELRADAIIVEK
ncbi:peptidylprolyl isomerase [Maritimibacter sp. 55A14]|uniref:peptidylprolyl isomerase n=1 Tax=Maritimibacter sp. 55A14 TaxID=2174844 RepID=UPI000D6185C7|nr:peptidylprolyl isomerase [Maritimibacter sp. 55A14]PWE34167.1 peptidylprolyl isomerase [Maritimibacter sp. 55A14]